MADSGLKALVHCWHRWDYPDCCFYVKKVPVGILLGILCTWLLGILLQVAGIYQPNPELGMYSVLPDFSGGFGIPSLKPTLMQMDFSGLLGLNFITVMLSFLFVDLFDTMGTLIGVASKADMLDEQGRLPRIRGALMADAVGTSLGAVPGYIYVSTYVESSSGVMAGGRTGLTSVVTGLLFAVALFLSPIFRLIPSFATAACAGSRWVYDDHNCVPHRFR